MNNNNSRISSVPPPPTVLLYLSEDEFNLRMAPIIETAVSRGIRSERAKTESKEITEATAISIITENTGYRSYMGIRTQIHRHIQNYRFDPTVGAKGTRFYIMSDIIEFCDILSKNKPKKTSRV